VFGGISVAFGDKGVGVQIDRFRQIHPAFREITRRLIGRYAGRIRPSDPASPEAGHPLGELSPREREVLSLIATGMSNAEIAGSLFISTETVKTYVSRILAKLGLRDRVQAVVFAYQEGLVSVRD